jgi:hypothetical protein
VHVKILALPCEDYGAIGALNGLFESIQHLHTFMFNCLIYYLNSNIRTKCKIFILCHLGLILRGSGIGALDGKKAYARCGWGGRSEWECVLSFQELWSS